MFLIFNTFVIALLGLAFVLKPSLQELGEWKLTRFDKMSISRGSVTMIESTNDRKTSIQCASWCTDFDNCRAFQWKENPETLCTLFESNEMCVDNDANDNLMLFVDQNQTLCGCDEMPCVSDDGYEFLKEGSQIACGATEQIGSYLNVDEAGCKNKCDADENCTYLFHRSQDQKCILYSSCDTLVDFQPKKGKLFKKKLH